jgi:hypothetical protein
MTDKPEQRDPPHAPPLILEYSRPIPDRYILRPPEYLIAPFSAGIAVGAATVALVGILLTQGGWRDISMGAIVVLAVLGVAFAVGVAVTMVLMSTLRILSGRRFEAVSDRTCFISGFGVGVGTIFMPWAALNWWPATTTTAFWIATTWFLFCCVVACVTLARPVR